MPPVTSSKDSIKSPLRPGRRRSRQLRFTIGFESAKLRDSESLLWNSVENLCEAGPVEWGEHATILR